MSLKEIQLNDKHIALGAKMLPFAGYNMPIKYSSETMEHIAVRNDVGIFDVSHMGEFFVDGAEATSFIQLITTNDVSKLSDGQAQYSCLTNEQGGVIDDLLIYRFNADSYMLVVNASNIDQDWDWIYTHGKDYEIDIKNRSSKYSLFAIQGPKATTLLQELTSIELKDIAFYTFRVGTIAGLEDVIVSATGYTGAGGFELYVKNEDAESLFDAILEKGNCYGLLPVGLGARDTLRLEMGYCLHGHELSTEINPLEAGLGWVTKLKTEFIGAEALRSQKTNGVTRKLIGFELLEKGIPRQGYELLSEGEVVGEVTSGTMSPMLKKGIGMGFINIDYAIIGNEIGVQVRSKILKAKIVKPPFITQS